MTPWLFAAAAVAGGVGAGLRYLIDVLVVGSRPGRFPLGIVVVNVTGSFTCSQTWRGTRGWWASSEKPGM